MTTLNPLDLEVGELVKITGEDFPEDLRGREARIIHIDDRGHAVFEDPRPNSVVADWLAFENGQERWAVERVHTPAGLRAAIPAGFKLNQLGDFSAPSEDEDLVNHPSHYKTASGLEAIDAMEAFNLHRDGRLFNAGKYILRAGQKDKESQDIRKAIWYLERYAADLEEQGK